MHILEELTSCLSLLTFLYFVLFQQSVPDLMPSIEDMMRILEERVDAGPLPNLTSLPDVQLTSDMHQELQNLLNQSQEAEVRINKCHSYQPEPLQRGDRLYRRQILTT